MTHHDRDRMISGDVEGPIDKHDYVVRSYQDGIDSDPNKVDPLMNELNDDPVEMLGIPASELKAELDKRDTDVVSVDDPEESDDMREEAESFVDNAE